MMTTEKPPRFKRATIQVAMSGDNGPEPIEVMADILGDWAVHRYVMGKPWTDQNGNYHSGLDTRFSVTHVPTGFKAYTFDKKNQARYFVENISRLELPELGSTFASEVSKKWSEAKVKQYRDATIALANEAKEANP